MRLAGDLFGGEIVDVPDDLARSEDRFLQVSWDAGRLFVHAASVAGVPGYRLDAGSAGDARALWEELTVRGATPAGLVVRDMLREYVRNSNGKIVLDGPAAELQDNEDVKEFYLGGGERRSFKSVKSFKRRKRWL